MDTREIFEETARDIVNYILDTDNHGLDPFPQSGVFQLVESQCRLAGLPNGYGAKLAAEIGAYLQMNGYITLGVREPDGVCDCKGCKTSVIVTPSGILFAGPPWNFENN